MEYVMGVSAAVGLDQADCLKISRHKWEMYECGMLIDGVCICSGDMYVQVSECCQ